MQFTTKLTGLQGSDMPAGAEGFQSGRLTMVREARAMKKCDLAVALSRTDATISKWENGTQRPDPSTVADIAAALKVSPSWFFLPLENDERAVFYRSLSTELKTMRSRARARLGFVEAIEGVLSQYMDFPDTDIPDLLDDTDFRHLRVDDIERIAEELRSHWQLGRGPISDLILLMENAGIILGEDEIGSIKLDGVSWWSSRTDRPYVLLAQDKKSGVRRRLDAAHELAHLVLHREVTPEQLVEHFSLIEGQAMALAGALLMPAREFKRSVYSMSLDGLLSIKREWGVSVGAMIKRLANLGEINSFNERRLWQYHSQRKWRTREPLDNELRIETPENLKICIESLDESGELTREALIDEVGLSVDDIATLCGIAPEYFARRASTVERFVPRSKEGTIESELHANVVPFKKRGA